MTNSCRSWITGKTLYRKRPTAYVGVTVSHRHARGIGQARPIAIGILAVRPAGAWDSLRSRSAVGVS
jgi:hypothetical protein